MITTKAASIILLLAFSISMACADTQTNRYHEFDADEVTTLRIDARVGTIRVEPSQSGRFEVELVITDEDHGGWFSRSPDIADMDLRSRHRGDQLRLSFNEDKVKGEWVVKVPALEQLDIELDVGTIKVYMAQYGIVAEIGVGTIELQASKSSIGSVDLSAGIGDTDIKGGTDTDNHRAMVSSETTAFGDGAMSIRARAGVGEVTAELM